MISIRMVTTQQLTKTRNEVKIKKTDWKIMKVVSIISVKTQLFTIQMPPLENINRKKISI